MKEIRDANYGCRFYLNDREERRGAQQKIGLLVRGRGIGIISFVFTMNENMFLVSCVTFSWRGKQGAVSAYDDENPVDQQSQNH